MIGILKVSGKTKVLYFKDKQEYGYIAVKEATKEEELPSGYYVVKLLEYKEGRFGSFPFVSLVKTLGKKLNVEEVVIALSELSLHTQKEVLPVLRNVVSEKEAERIKNLLNCIAITDKKELLFQEEPLEDPFLEELGINIKEVRRVYHEILGVKQERNNKDLQGRLPGTGELFKT